MAPTLKYKGYHRTSHLENFRIQVVFFLKLLIELLCTLFLNLSLINSTYNECFGTTNTTSILPSWKLKVVQL